MSQILASHLLRPREDDPIEKKSFKLDSKIVSFGAKQRISQLPVDLIPAHQRKMLRSISRATILLSGVCGPLRPQFQRWIDQDPFSVGVYCAVESVPVDDEVAKELSQYSEDKWMEIFKSRFPPKNALKINLGVASASLGLMLGAMGPVNTFYESTYGVLHALQEAELDLFEGRIQVAVVGAAHSLDDDLMWIRKAAIQPELILKENAVAVVLTRNSVLTNWEEKLSFSNREFGIASPLMDFVQKKEWL